MQRQIEKLILGTQAIDGAGVKLTRVLGAQSMQDFDPFLMLDSFDSTNPTDYIKSFPMHPHRGIETISYIAQGAMTHKDSLGNVDTIRSGEVQWMSAGSGILHEEILPESPRMLGVQIWLNLPKQHKMSQPSYKSIKQIPTLTLECASLKLISGEYQGAQGFKPKFLPLDFYDIHLAPNMSQTITTKPSQNVVLFLLQGDALVQGQLVREKTAIKLSPGGDLSLSSMDKNAQILFLSSIALHEPTAWGGPVVMNTKKELQEAFKELREGTFIKHSTRIS
ncbi:pirin family protein [uncultured Helicobacter sp.]|uniref:pirin family protein n=1 Tax=uncultured Helicobacter sp. TaxID=175537 RepID=UPI00258698C4|nr:pirin family protein [uncultured Helicobacter sp.]